jgi:hypothetical protein
MNIKAIRTKAFAWGRALPAEFRLQCTTKKCATRISSTDAVNPPAMSSTCFLTFSDLEFFEELIVPIRVLDVASQSATSCNQRKNGAGVAMRLQFSGFNNPSCLPKQLLSYVEMC